MEPLSYKESGGAVLGTGDATVKTTGRGAGRELENRLRRLSCPRPRAADLLHHEHSADTLPPSLSSADPAVQTDGSPLCCHFHFSPKVMFTKVLKAQLWVYLRPVPRPATVYLQILRLKPLTGEGTAGGGGGGRRHIRIRSLKIDLHSRSGHWQSIDFKQVLHSWFRQPQSNWGIEINAFDPSGTDLAVTSLGPGAEGLVSREPVILAAMYNLALRRWGVGDGRPGI